MSINDRKVIPAEVRTSMELLTPKERDYFKMMWPTSGVLYITAKPGVAKSAIAREIAVKMGYEYQDHRLSMKDETDLGLFPDKVEIDGIKYLDFITPIWAHEANQKPTIIHFEELNRSSQQVRNAALQLLLERGIGPKFRFNSNVLMLASGNLGDEDGTDVEEFDKALNGRLIHVPHELKSTDWIEGYANDNIHKSIVAFISARPEYMYKDPTNDQGNTSKAYASPRTWTFLSDYIVCNYGPDAEVGEFLRDVKRVGACYVGAASIASYVEYWEALIKVSIRDVINRYDEVKDELIKCERSKRSELVQNLKEIDIETLSKAQIDNIHKFLLILGEDEKMDYILDFLDKVGEGENTVAFLQKYDELLMNIGDLSTKLNEKKSLATVKDSPKKKKVK